MKGPSRDTKVCSKCRVEQSTSNFSLQKDAMDGLRSQCKLCIKASSKVYNQANREKIKASYQANREKRLEYRKAYYQANKDRIKVYAQENKERKAEYQKAYQEENKEKIAARKKAHRQENRVRILEYNKAYREENKEKVAELKAKRRAMKRQAIPKFLKDCRLEKQRLLLTYRLRYAMTKATGILHHVDHMWPLSGGGPHWSGNLQVITAKENLSKGSKVCPDIKATVKESLENARQRYQVQEIRMEV